MKPRSTSRRGQTPKGCIAAFFGVFLLAGLAASYVLVWKPWSAWVEARFWQETPCTIIDSRVAEISGDGTTYRVDITYSYLVGPREYRSSRYDFTTGSSSGRDSKAAVVAAHPPGSRATCWVDPDDPSQAVFDRGLNWVFLVGLFPLLFVAVGAGGIFFGLRSKKLAQAAAGAPASSPFGVDIPPQGMQARLLAPQASPLGKFIWTVIIAVFWDGIVGIFVFKMVESWRAGKPLEGCLVAFLVPFVLIGLFLIFGVFQQFLVLFNPRLQLTLGPGVLAPGESSLLQWTVTGKADRVQKLRIVLEGREEATYRQGTRTTTAREVFATILLAEVDNPFSIANGTARVSLPEGSMPSFAASRNKIVWTLKATLDIPNWPDSDDEYEIVVAPAALRQRFGG